MFLSLVFSLVLFIPSITVAAEAVQNVGQVWEGNGWINLLPKDMSKPQPYPPPDDSFMSKDTTIFIGISAFRDHRCPATLFNYFSKAKYPSRLHIGLVYQYEIEEDKECVEEYCRLMQEAKIKAEPDENGEVLHQCPYRANIKSMNIEAKLAAGPCYGRHLQSYMYRDETFCMQTDSHMDVVPQWDTTLVDMWARTRNEYAVVTTYVHIKESIKTLEEALDRKKHVPIMCQVGFTDEMNPRYEQAKLATGLLEPKLGTSWAAGFSFGKCHHLTAVPYDPQMKYIFDGEEFTMAARLWTRGYDFYTPDFSLIGHDYNKVESGPSPHGWYKNLAKAQHVKEASKARMRTILGIKGQHDPDIEAEIGPYGLGTKRTIKQFEEYVGVNLSTLTHTGSRCGTLDWVPFIDGPPLGEENNLVGPYWNQRKLEAEKAAADIAAKEQEIKENIHIARRDAENQPKPKINSNASQQKTHDNRDRPYGISESGWFVILMGACAMLAGLRDWAVSQRRTNTRRKTQSDPLPK